MLLAGFGVLKGGKYELPHRRSIYVFCISSYGASKNLWTEWLKTDRLDMLSFLNSGLWFERDFFIVVIFETKIVYFKVLINAFRNLMMV